MRQLRYVGDDSSLSEDVLAYESEEHGSESDRERWIKNHKRWLMHIGDYSTMLKMAHSMLYSSDSFFKVSFKYLDNILEDL